jgi:hypothetical protein
MAFPQVYLSASSQQTSATTSHTVSLPAEIQAGELLIVAFGYGDDSTITFPGGWTQKARSQVNFASGTWAYRVADGSEGATITVTSGTARQSAHRSWRIQGHSTSTNPMTDNGAWAFGSSTTPDASSYTPTGGAKDYLWMWFCSGASGRICTAAPANYGNLGTSDSGSTAAVSIAMSTARRELNAASEDPGTATLESSGPWVAMVIAVHPGTEGNPAAPEPKVISRPRTVMPKKAQQRASRW